AVPTAKGIYPRGPAQKDIDKLLAAIQAIANDSGFAIPAGMDVELLTLAQSGADFQAVCRYMDGAIAKVILSQTMTTDNGSSRAQGEVHADVK
ncbi:phage portal protein family protein, partial [Salmonella enterica]